MWELVAGIVCIKQFHYNLLGRHFLLVTDLASLAWLVNFVEPVRWKSGSDFFLLETFHFETQHTGCAVLMGILMTYHGMVASEMQVSCFRGLCW